MAKAQMKKTEDKINEQTSSANLPIRRIQNDFGFGRDRTSPFTLMRHLAEDMENLMADFNIGRRPFAPLFSRQLFRPDFFELDEAPFFSRAENFFGQWPQVEMFDRDGKLIIQADLPGLSKEDIKVELKGDSLMIEGKREDNKEEKGEGFYRSERYYGSFCREIPLPEGVKTENAKAEFRNGVLEVSMEAPQLYAAGKKLEITEG